MVLRIRRRYDPLNDVTLYGGDCLGLLGQLPDSAAQLIITSPPYNLGKQYERRRSLRAYTEEQARVIAECARITRDGGSICWQVGMYACGHQGILPLDIHLHRLFTEQDLRLRNRLIWHFEHGLHCRNRFSGRHETILWYTKGERYHFDLDAVRVPQKYPGKKAYKGPNAGKYSGNPRGKNPGDVWVFPNVKNNHVEKTIHPCQFPVELPERLILALTRPGQLVVDPFLGVGTTAVAAVIHGRRVAGAEVVAEYVEQAKRRVRLAAKGHLPIRPLGRPVYVPPLGTSLTTQPWTPTHEKRASVRGQAQSAGGSSGRS